MLAMLVVATALMKFNVVLAKPLNEAGFYSSLFRRNFNEDISADMEQLLRFEHDKDVEKRGQSFTNYYAPASQEVDNTEPNNTILGIQDYDKKRWTETEVDVVDRADHITQYLADMFVNTDSEITSLQAVEPEDYMLYAPEYFSDKADTFFEFLTSQERNTGLEMPSFDLSS